MSVTRFVYVAENRSKHTLKIGCSTNPLHRVLGLGLWLLGYELGQFADERKLHAKFAHARLAGECFRDIPEIRSFALQMKCEEIQFWGEIREMDNPPSVQKRLEETQREFMRTVDAHMRQARTAREG